MTSHELATLEPLIAEYTAAGFDRERAIDEAAREARMTSGNPYAFRTDDELDAMRADEAAHMDALRAHAGVCDEFPAGEFAVPGLNCESAGY